MKHRVLAALILASCCGAALAQEVQWQQAYGQEGRFYNPTAAASAPDGSFYIAGTATVPGLGGGGPEFWVWKIGADGNVIQQTPIAAGQQEDRINPSVEHIRDLVTTGNGAATIVEFVLGDPYYVAFDAETRVTRMQRLEFPQRTHIYVNRLLAREQGEMLAFGAADGKALAFRVSREGKVVWSKPEPSADLFIDAVEQADGGFVAVGYSKARQSEFLLTYFDVAGNIRKNVFLKGRRVSIAAADNGGAVIVYDRASGDDRDIHVAALRDGVLSGDQRLPPFLIAPFRIAQTSGNRHLIGGTTENESVVVMRYGDGKVLSLYQSDPDAMPQHWELARLNGFPASAVTTVYASGKPLTTKVGIIRFKDD